MSDHWNSLANLLGTPSINPPNNKRSEKSKSASDVAAVPATAHPPESTSTSPKTKETSRLRSSWDAVTSFFGIQSADPTPGGEEGSRSTVSSSSPKETRDSTSASPRSRGNANQARKPKTSAWEDDATTESNVVDKQQVDHSSATNNRASREVSEREQRADRNAPAKASKEIEEPNLTFGEPKRTRREERQGRESNTPNNLQKSLNVDSEPSLEAKGNRARRGAPQTEEPNDAAPERRSHRRPPRRGLSEGSTEGFAENPTPEEASPPPAQNRSRRSSSNEDRNPDSRESRPQRPERADRPTSRRGSRDESRPSSRSQSSSANESRDNDSSLREKPDSRRRDSGRERDPASRRREQPAADSSLSSGFGAGLGDTESVASSSSRSPTNRRGARRSSSRDLDHRVDSDRLDSEQSANRSSDENEILDEDRSLRKKRPRRRGKGSEKSSKTALSEEEIQANLEEEREAIAAVARHSKIPSWAEAIGGLVTVNMENHNRQSHSGGRGRGRSSR